MDMATEKKEVKPVLKKDALVKGVVKKDKVKPAPNKKARKFDLKKSVAAIGHFFRDVVSELKKVSWAGRKEFISYSVAVLVFVAVFGLIIFAMDTALGGGISKLVALISA
jgi:preprotein translocase subunit SecE